MKAAGYRWRDGLFAVLHYARTSPLVIIACMLACVGGTDAPSTSASSPGVFVSSSKSESDEAPARKVAVSYGTAKESLLRLLGPGESLADVAVETLPAS